MKALFDDFPALKVPFRQELFDDLTTTLQARPAAKGSTEALLLDWARRPGSAWGLGLFRDVEDLEADAPAREIVLRGFDAIPDLIALLSDRRVTVHEGTQRVGDLAEGLLQEITAREIPHSEGPRDAAAWSAWWKQARRQRERDFLTAAVFRRQAGKIAGVNEGPARILAHKYPDALPALCDEFSRDAAPEAQPCGLAEAMAVARLPQETRVKTLAAFAQRGTREHQRWVLDSLAQLDPQRCAEILRPLLNRLPADATGPYWTCSEAAFTYVVLRVEDDGVWRDYLGAATAGHGPKATCGRKAAKPRITRKVAGCDWKKAAGPPLVFPFAKELMPLV
jgi:hypothetical protein